MKKNKPIYKITEVEKEPFVCSYKNCPAKNDTSGIMLKNIDNGFFNMKRNESMHLECYIRHCVERAIEEQVKPLK
jgi:hypothetical protein